MAKIWVSPVFDLILRQNIREKNSCFWRDPLREKTCRFSALWYNRTRAAACSRCAAVFFGHAHSMLPSMGLVSFCHFCHPDPWCHPSELLPFGGQGEPRSGHQPESQAGQNRNLWPYPSSSSKIQTGSCSGATSLWDGSSDNSRIRLVVRWWWVVREWGCSVSYSHCSFESTVIKS